MKSFGQILQDTAALFLMPELGAEQIIYTKTSGEGIEAGDIAKMAAAGVLTGRPGAMATMGVIERRRRFTGRQISALVNRRGVAEIKAAPQGHGPQLTIKVANDSDSGISSSEVNIGKDKVTLPVIVGEAAQELRIVGILRHDEGMMTLELGC